MLTPSPQAHAPGPQVGCIPLEGVVEVLSTALRTAAWAPAAASDPAHPTAAIASSQPALRGLCSHLSLRLVREVSPLHSFLAAPERRAAWCALPVEVVAALLAHEELQVDVEESGALDA